MCMQVDKARRDNHPAGIDALAGLLRFEVADFGNPAVLYAQVGLIARHSRTINYHSPADEHIKFSHVHSPKSEVYALPDLARQRFLIRIAATAARDRWLQAVARQHRLIPGQVPA